MIQISCAGFGFEGRWGHDLEMAAADCVTYQFNFAPGASLLAISIHAAVGFMPRARLVDHVRKTEGLALCGRGAACPG